MRRIAVFGLGAAVLLLTACGGDGNGTTGPAGEPTTLAALSGDAQRVAVRGMLVAPFVVKVTDASNRAVSGVTVNWTVTGGGGSLSAATSTTNSFGEASVTLTAGATAGANTVTAAVSGLTGSPATFTATALEPAAIVIVGGNGQTARTTQPLADSLKIRVNAGDGDPLPGAQVVWVATAGGGTFSNPNTLTNASGRAATVLTLGNFPVGNTVTATIASTAISATLNATATSPVSVEVTMQNTAFNAPGGGDDVTILLGDTVRWVNLDNDQHTATSSFEPTDGRAFDSGLLSLNDTFVFVPNVRGQWTYLCEVHPVSMQGARITVN